MTDKEEDGHSVELPRATLCGLPHIALVLALCLASASIFLYWEEPEIIFPALVAVGIASGGRPISCALGLAASKTLLILGSVLVTMRGIVPGWSFDCTYLKPALCSFALDSVLLASLGCTVFIVWHAAILRRPRDITELLRLADVYWLAFFSTIMPLVILGATFDHNSRLLKRQYNETKALEFNEVCQQALNSKESLRKRSLAILMLREKSRGASREKGRQVAEQIAESEAQRNQIAKAASLCLGAMEGEDLVARITGDATSPFEILDVGWTCYNLDERAFYDNMRLWGWIRRNLGLLA